MSLSERLKIARESTGKSQKEMAQLCGASYRAWQGYEAGETPPKADNFESLVKLGFNANWLLTGEGEMRRDVKPAVHDATPGWEPANGHPASKSERTRITEIAGEPIPQPEHERLDRKLLFITIARLQQVFNDFGINDPQDQAGVITDVYSHIIEKHLDRTDNTVDGLAKTMSRLFADVELLKSLPSLGLGFLSKIPGQLWERLKLK